MDDREDFPTVERSLELARGSVSLERRSASRFTTGIKLAGNGVVALGGMAAWLPVVILPLLGVWYWGVVELVAAILVGVLWAVALTDNGSLWKNRDLRDAAMEDLRRSHPELVSSFVAFVGFSTHPHLFRQFQRLDTHEDVGCLCATSSRLVFLGDQMDVTIPRHAITGIEFRLDPCCSFIGLHWIRVAYTDGGQTHFVYLQSRERDRLSELPRRNRGLLERLKAWRFGRAALPHPSLRPPELRVY